MSTDNNAMRERAWLWLNSTPLNRDQKMVAIDSLAALLTASVADAVAQERDACAKIASVRAREWERAANVSRRGGGSDDWSGEMARYNEAADIAFNIRARTTTPTPSPTEGRVPLPSGEQPGVGELMDQFEADLRAIEDVVATIHPGRRKEFYALITKIRTGLRARARQPRADYDAGERGEEG